MRTLTLDQAQAHYTYLYCADLDEIFEIDELDDIIQRLIDINIKVEDARIYGTTLETAIKIDISDVVEDACMELNGDLFDCIHKEDLANLQAVVNQWISDTSGLKIYTPDYSVRVSFKGLTYEN